MQYAPFTRSLNSNTTHLGDDANTALNGHLDGEIGVAHQTITEAWVCERVCTGGNHMQSYTPSDTQAACVGMMCIARNKELVMQWPDWLAAGCQPCAPSMPHTSLTKKLASSSKKRFRISGVTCGQESPLSGGHTAKATHGGSFTYLARCERCRKLRRERLHCTPRACQHGGNGWVQGLLTCRPSMAAMAGSRGFSPAGTQQPTLACHLLILSRPWKMPDTALYTCC